MRLHVDISSHGLGHLAIAAPILEALAERRADLVLTVRSGLPEDVLRQRLSMGFAYLPGASDFGFCMRDALAIDLPASARLYREVHADWRRRVAEEAERLAASAPDLVLSNVSYLPLAGAAAAGIPAAAVCSLNWADLFRHFFGALPWAGAVHAEMLAAYRSARAFLRVTPGMPMDELDNLEVVGPVARRGQRRELGFVGPRRNVLVALGGIAHRIPLEDWPVDVGVRWLVPGEWACRHPDALAWEETGLPFPDLLASVDAVLTKPGYGTFCEAAACGTPVLYERRPDWPEQDFLIAWQKRHGRCRELPPGTLALPGKAAGLWRELDALWREPPPPPPLLDGAVQAAERLIGLVAQPRRTIRSGSPGV